MSELQDRLSQALGSAYRLEQELGGGGMSRVFLAEDVELGRKVVVKVLPPEMAAGVNQDRFRREIQLAARLQHPHIVALLSAGSSGDLLYYIMPYIKGESLRAKLAREGELPVVEAARILREVTDGLAYAHGEGVVHRDIKPDNVMISGGHALVTDFGVAKAVSESAGEHSLTSLGLAIGTPAYMAPEQASGDPHVDHRADLYALGAMAFEMLIGRPPFMGANAQALLAAHVTQTPEHVSQLRPAVPPALDALVARCLEKRAADRWQQASDLLPPLELLATPSAGGTAPTMAAYISSGTEAALRRAHPSRVIVSFALSAVAVLGAVWLLVRQLGLPYWVLFVAVALVVLALPVVVVTGRHERARALARTTAGGFATTAARPAVHGVFTWRRLLMGGALAFVALGIAAAAWMALRLMGIGAVGTLMAKGALNERDRIVLADFDNRTPDTTLGQTITELLRTDLAQSTSVSVYDAAQLADVIARMQLPRNARITFEVAKEAATREGLKAILAGDIAALGSGYIVSARLVATTTGDVLWAARENVANADGLASAVDRLSAALRERVGESLRIIRADPPLEQMTTQSTEALRLFAQAERVANSGDNEGAIALLRRAISLDTNFAMAQRKVGILLVNQGGDTIEEHRAFTRAWALRDRVSERERYLAEAAYDNYVAHDTDKTVAAYRAVLDRYPDDRVAANNLGLIFRERGQDADALALYKTSIRYGTAPPATYTNAIGLVTEREGLDSAHALIEAFAAAYPSNPQADMLRAQYLAAIGQLDSAESILRRRLESSRSNPRLEITLGLILYPIQRARGRLRDAEALYRQAMHDEVMTFGALLGNPEPDAFVDAQLLALRENIALNIERDTAAAVTLLEQLPGRVPARQRAMNEPGFDLQMAQLWAAAGRVDQAKVWFGKWLASAKDSAKADPPIAALSAQAGIASLEGRHDDAFRDLRAYRGKNPSCRSCFLYPMADVFEAAGQADSALAYYAQALAIPSLGVRDGANAEHVARLYETVHDTANAIAQYRIFVALWKGADAPLQPRVAAARARITALGGAPPP